VSTTVARRCLIFSVWGLVLTGTLSIANWPGDWGHSICGAWGCGPPLQALLACHCSWLVVFVPVALLLTRKVSIHTAIRGASVILAIILLITTTIAIHEYLTWKLQVSPWQQQYYWHRVGFVILTTIEVPLLELAGLATGVLLWAMIVGKTDNRRGNVDLPTSPARYESVEGDCLQNTGNLPRQSLQ